MARSLSNSPERNATLLLWPYLHVSKQEWQLINTPPPPPPPPSLALMGRGAARVPGRVGVGVSGFALLISRRSSSQCE